MRTRLMASVVVLLVGGLAWVGCEAVAGTQPVRFDKEKGMSEPKLVHKVDPVYPEEARAEGVQGVVLLDAVVAVDGRVAEVTPVQDPDPRLTRAATEAVLQWKFEPARDAQGKPVAVVYTVTVAFKLK